MLRGTASGVRTDPTTGKLSTSIMPFTDGTAAPNGDNVTLAFSFAHGLNTNPSWVGVTPRNQRSCGDYYVTWDATNITVTYAIAPNTGALSLSYIAVM